MNVIALLDKFYYRFHCPYYSFDMRYSIFQVIGISEKPDSFIVLFNDMSIGDYSIKISNNNITLSDITALTRYYEYEFDSIKLDQLEKVSWI